MGCTTILVAYDDEADAAPAEPSRGGARRAGRCSRRSMLLALVCVPSYPSWSLWSRLFFVAAEGAAAGDVTSRNGASFFVFLNSNLSIIEI
jgi:hypothetical protein